MKTLINETTGKTMISKNIDFFGLMNFCESNLPKGHTAISKTKTGRPSKRFMWVGEEIKWEAISNN